MQELISCCAVVRGKGVKKVKECFDTPSSTACYGYFWLLIDQVEYMLCDHMLGHGCFLFADSLVIMGETEESHPNTVFMKFSRDFPELEFEVYSSEDKVNYSRILLKNSVVIEQEDECDSLPEMLRSIPLAFDSVS